MREKHESVSMESCEGNSNRDVQEFRFLERWTFSSLLESRLMKFTSSSSYKIAIKSPRADHDTLSPIHVNKNPEENDSVDQMNQDIKGNQGTEQCVVAADLGVMSQQLLGTQETLKSIAILREGPVQSDVLCGISNEDMISLLSGASDDIIFNFCQSVCSALEHQIRLVPLLCEHLLLPKIKDPAFTTSRTLLPTIKKTFETFPSEACSFLLVPLLHDPDWHCKLDPFLTDLQNGTKLTILKSLIDGGIEILEEHHIPLMQNLLVTSVDKDVNEKLIDLLLVSGSNLCKSANFGKLLVCVTKQIGPSLDAEAKTKLSSAIEMHKSIQKTLAMRALQSLDM